MDNNNKEKIMETIVKLKSLATSPNEHESMLALAKMQKMMDKHNITSEMLKALQNNEIFAVEEEWTTPNLTGLKEYEIQLAFCIARLFDSKTLSRKCWDVNYRHHKRRIIIFVGVDKDPLVAREMFEWILANLTKVCSATSKVEHAQINLNNVLNNTHRRFNRGRFRDSFFYGCISTINNKIDLILEERKKNFTVNSELKTF